MITFPLALGSVWNTNSSHFDMLNNERVLKTFACPMLNPEGHSDACITAMLDPSARQICIFAYISSYDIIIFSDN